MLYYSASNIKGKKQKKNSDLSKSSSSKRKSLYTQLDKSTNDDESNNHSKNNNNNGGSLINKNFTGKNNQSTSIFSPHNSVFQALQNPDLNIGFDLNKVSNNIVENNNNDDSEGEIDNDNDHYKNNEFSITSWQSISDEQHLDGSSINLPYQFSSNNNSNIISTNNSPFLKYSEFHNYDNINSSITNITNITNNNSPNRNNSPNVASILSSSSDHDYQNLTDNSNNPNEVDIEIPGNNYNDESLIKLTHDALISSGIAILDSDCDSVTDDDEYTVDSSTIIPSFVMPRVSIPSLLKLDYSKSINRDNNNSINIQIIGYNNQILINRFKCYKKTLKNINFYNRIQNNVDINLSLLIVTEENFLLPKLTKIPCIPIIFQNQPDASSHLQKIPKHLLVCKPIILESLNDDLMILIDFLSNINNNIISWNKLLNDIEFDESLNLNNLNSILIEKNSLIENSSSIFSGFLNKSSIISKNFANDGEISDKKDNGFLKTKLIAGLTIGILSLTVIIVWKNLSTSKSKNNSIQLQSKNNKSHLAISLSKKNFVPETESYNSALTFDQLVFLKLKSLTEKLESWSKLLLSSSLMIIERTKLTLVQLISLSS